jgi:hypothetical protein
VVRFLLGVVPAGAPAEATGSLPEGTYELCVVPNDTYKAGQPYTGPTPPSCVQVAASGGALPQGSVVWASTQAGSYDLLAFLASPRGAGPVILAGDHLGPEPGLLVQPATATPSATPTETLPPPTVTPTSTPVPGQQTVPGLQRNELTLALLAVAGLCVLTRRRRA